MGTQVSVAVFSQRLYNPDFLLTGHQEYAKAIIQNKSPIDALTDIILKGRHIDLHKYYRYGTTEYVNELPSLTYTFNVFSIQNLRNRAYMVEDALTDAGFTVTTVGETALPDYDANVNPPLLPIYESFEPPTDDFTWRTKLYQEHTYNALEDAIVLNGELVRVYQTLVNDYVVEGSNLDAEWDVVNVFAGFQGNDSVARVDKDFTILFQDKLVYDLTEQTLVEESTTGEFGAYDSIISDVTIDVGYTDDASGQSTTTGIVPYVTTIEESFVDLGSDVWRRTAIRTTGNIHVTAYPDVKFTQIKANVRAYQAVYTVNNGRDVGLLGYYTEALYTTTIDHIEVARLTAINREILVLARSDAIMFFGMPASAWRALRKSVLPAGHHAPVEANEYSSMYPVVPLNTVGYWIDAKEEIDSDWYITSKKLLEYLNLDMDKILESIKESPDIASVQSAGIMLGVDIAETNQACKEYIYRFCTLLSNQERSFGTHDTGQVVYRFGEEKRIQGKPQFNHMLTYHTIIHSIVPSTLGTGAGKYDVEVLSDTSFKVLRGISDTQANQLLFTGVRIYVEVSMRGTSKTGNGTYHMSANVVDNTFIFPLIVGVFKELSYPKQHEVAQRCPHLYIYAGKFKKLKWYQSPTFIKFIGIVLAIAAFYFTGPWGAEATAAAWITYAIVSTLELIVLHIVVDMVLSIAARSDNAIVDFLAVIAVIAVAFYVGGLTFDISTMGIVELLAATVAAAPAVAAVYNANTMAQIEDFDQTLQQLEDINKEYAAIIEGMDDGAYFGYSIITTKAETPDLFFARTLNTALSDVVLDMDIKLVNTTDLFLI